MNELYCEEGRVETLKGRAKRCVCKYCGGELRVKRIMFSDYEDARIEIYCEHCERLEYGIEPEIYASAKRFVEQLELTITAIWTAMKKQSAMNIAKVCEIMAWGYQDLAVTDENGFTVTLPERKHSWEECMVLSDDEVPEEAE